MLKMEHLISIQTLFNSIKIFEHLKLHHRSWPWRENSSAKKPRAKYDKNLKPTNSSFLPSINQSIEKD